MKNKSLTQLGETEMEVLQHVWELGKATVADVQARILSERPIAYTTVMTVMKNLADKGYLHFAKSGNAYEYFPNRAAEEVRHSLVQTLVEKVFKGSPTALIQNLVRHEDLTDEERKEIAEMIRKMEDDDASA